MVKNLSILALILFAVLFGLLIRDYMSLPDRNLVIFYTSNLRGQVKPFSGTVLDRKYDQIGGLAFVKGFIKETANAFNFNPDEVFLLDTGDALFGSAEASLSMGEIILRLMNRAGYDAMAIGNFEFEYGFDRLKFFLSSGLVPMLACNFRDVTSPVGDTFKSGLIIEKGGIKLGIIGLGHGELARNTRQDNIVNLEIIDMQASVHNTAAQLKAEGAEMILLLSHHPALGAIENPAKLFPDVDIIIGDLIGPSAVLNGNPMICQTAPSRGSGVGMIKISHIGGRWETAKGFQRIFTIDSSKITPEPALAAEISRVESKIDSLLDEVIATSKGDFSNSYTEESTVGSLLTDYMRTGTETNIALANSGGIKSSLSPGKITLRHLYDLLPFDNNLVTIELQGWQIENLIENSLSGTTGFLQASGINCIYASNNPPGFRIIQIEINGVPLEYNNSYSVAVNDFMYANDMDWPELKNGKNPSIKGLIREGLEKYLRQLGQIEPDLEKRFNDFADLDETLRIQALSYELASLTQPITHDGTNNSQYSRTLAEIIRLETGTDFVFLPTEIVRTTREPLMAITPARIISDFSTREGVVTAEISGKDLQQLVRLAVTSPTFSLAFSGLSVEMLDNNDFKILPWSGIFAEENLYKIALNENFPEKIDGFFDFSALKKEKFCSDMRRTFINGLRKRNGLVELKRALY